MKKTTTTKGDAHYADAKYYDQAYRKRRHDVEYYVEVAERHKGPILELGCGTGRVSVAIARAGKSVVGVDRMPQMLSQAKERANALPKSAQSLLEFRKGDIRKVRLGKQFGRVISPFNVFMHLYTRKDFEDTLETVKAHLLPKGRFIFDVLLPYPTSLGRDPDKRYRVGHVRHPKDGERYKYNEYFSYDAATQVQTVLMDFEHPTHPRKSFVTPLTQRQHFPAELEALLHYNGFKVLEHCGDFKGGAITTESDSQVIVAKLK